MKRRSAIVAGAGAAAALAGAAWWTLQDDDGGVPDGFWSMRFSKPSGGELALADFLGKPVLLNFWATWCEPCIAEMPLIDAWYRARREAGWRVLGLAVDNTAPVQAFLERRPVGFDVGMAGFEGVGLVRAFGNPNGGLPFSVVFDRRGRIVARKLGAMKQADLDGFVSRAG